MKHEIGIENNTRDMMKSHYGDEKINKSDELNESMSISNSSRDEYTQKIHSIGGNNNG